MAENESSVENGSNGYELNTRRKISLSIDIIFFIVGFFGNGSVIYLTLRHKGLRSIPNLMIANLAVGDMLVVILVIFINILHHNLASVRVFVFQYCAFLTFVQFLSQGVSVFTLTALSVDRFTTVAYPLHKQRYARKLSIWTVVGIWTTSIIVLWPIVAFIDDNCWFPNETSYTAYLLCLVFLLYVIPSAVMVICYVLTSWNLLRRKPSLKLDPRGGRQQQQKRSRLAVIVLIMTVAFILSSSLLYIWLVVFLFAPTNAFVRNVFLNEARTVLLKFNSIFNPVILYLMSSTYRRHLVACSLSFKANDNIFGRQSFRTSFSRITDLSRQNAIKRDYAVINAVINGRQGDDRECGVPNGNRVIRVTEQYKRMPSIKEEESKV